jgi:hypothetical protein
METTTRVEATTLEALATSIAGSIATVIVTSGLGDSTVA